MKVEGGAIRMRFSHATGGLQAKGGPLKQFALAGDDHKFVWAKAEIAGNDEIIVTSPEVPQPTSVRYAWADNPEGCNLYNAENLPAMPFRIDIR
jgi:sialate O-acetylesterase